MDVAAAALLILVLLAVALIVWAIYTAGRPRQIRRRKDDRHSLGG